MRIAVCGGTGATGRHVVDLALDAGHEVVVSARTPERVERSHPRLRVVPGDATDAASLATAFDGSDVVVSCLGSESWQDLVRATTFYRVTATAILEAMGTAGVLRVLAITSSGVEHDPESPWWYRRIVRPRLQNIYDDMACMEEFVEASDVEWTLVRPTFLRPGGPSGDYRVRDRRWPEGGWQVDVGNVAHFMVTELEGRSWLGRHPTLAR